jgi:CheY-like chemotaxis protein
MEDEGSVREVIGAVLEQEGFEVELTESGEQAIESYRRALDDSRPFDVVILDLTVRGGMGGREAIGRLIELDPTVAAIVVSGYSNDPVMARFTEFGFRACVAKPFRPDDLARAVDGVVKERRAAAGERAGTSRPTPRR